MYVVRAGSIRVYVTANDQEKTLAILGAGEFVGEMSLLKGGNAVATVTTVTPTEIVSASMWAQVTISAFSEGTQVTGTGHPMIMRAEEEYPAMSAVRGWLGAFEVDVRASDEVRPLAPSILTGNQPYDLVLERDGWELARVSVGPQGAQGITLAALDLPEGGPDLVHEVVELDRFVLEGRPLP